MFYETHLGQGMDPEQDVSSIQFDTITSEAYLESRTEVH